MRDINRTFEIAGVGGGRRVFYYEADTVNHILYLQDKFRESPDFASRKKKGPKKKPTLQKNFLTDEQEYAQVDPAGLTGRRLKGIPQERAQETKRKRMELHYETTDGKQVILKGTNENKEAIEIVLQRVNRQYALKPSTLSAGKY